MFTYEEFKSRTNWKMSYAEYVACCCERYRTVTPSGASCSWMVASPSART